MIKKKAIVIEFFDNCKYLRDHSEARIKVYRSEPGFNIKMPKNKVLCLHGSQMKLISNTSRGCFFIDNPVPDKTRPHQIGCNSARF